MRVVGSMRVAVAVGVTVAAVGLVGVLAAAATPFVPGAYETTIRGASPARFDGTWVLMLDGRSFTITRNKRVAVSGSITSSGTGSLFTMRADRTHASAPRRSGPTSGGSRTTSSSMSFRTTAPGARPC